MNLLGVALMRVREQVCKEEEKKKQEKKGTSKKDMITTF